MRGIRVVALAGVVFAAGGLVGCGGGGEKKATPKTHQQIVRETAQGTVEITARVGNDYYGGTGIVLNVPQGLVLTAAHVVAGASTLSTRYKDQIRTAQLLGEAPCEDIAMLKVSDPQQGMRAIPLGHSDQIQSGQEITLLGFPQSFQNPKRDEKVVSAGGHTSVDGTVSATPDDSLPEYSEAIEHDAASTHGDSGGPVVNAKGKLVGMTVLGNPEADNQNYAVAVDHIRRFLPALKAGKFTAYVGWDLIPVSQLSEKDKNDIGWKYVPFGANQDEGMFILGVDSDSPSANHKFGFGDYVREINHSAVNTMSDVCEILESNEGRIIDVKGYDLFDTGDAYHEKMRVR